MTSLSPKGIISFTLTWGVLGPLALSVTKVRHFKDRFSVVGRSGTQKDLLFLSWSQKGVVGARLLSGPWACRARALLAWLVQEGRVLTETFGWWDNRWRRRPDRTSLRCPPLYWPPLGGLSIRGPRLICQSGKRIGCTVSCWWKGWISMILCI